MSGEARGTRRTPRGPGTRSGFIALAGRPNVGKSTLANAIVGAKVAIVSDKPQTTRRAIRGVATGPDWQLVLVDLPGVQRPRDALTERMQSRVERELADADGALFVVNAEQGIGPGDRFIAELLRSVERAGRDGGQQGRSLRPAADGRGAPGRRRPRRRRRDVPRVRADRLRACQRSSSISPPLLPPGPFYFEPRQHSDQSEHVVLAELIREQVLLRTREELPHAVEVEIESIDRDRSGLVRIEAVILAETESQKGILIGAGGRMVKAIGTAARRAIERELGDARPPRPVRPRPPALARRRAGARPARNRVGLRPSQPAAGLSVRTPGQNLRVVQRLNGALGR